jgi:GNAT superfamily N-acetyltransferase
MTMISLAEAVPRHVDSLTALMHRSTAYHGKYAAILDGYRLTPDYIDQHPTYVAAAADEITGFYSLILRPPELDLLFVDDSAQGLGIGAMLVTHMLNQAAARGIMTVRVVSHPPAAGFYLRLGARRIGMVPPRPPRITWPRPELVFDVLPAPVE